MRKKIVYLSIVTSLIGANVISISIGSFQLSLFRALIILVTLMILFGGIVKNEKIVIGKENKFSITFMLIWVLYAIFTLGWVKDYTDWIRAVYFLSLGFLCVIIFSKHFKAESDILNSFRLMAIMVMFHNILGWYEIFTGNYMFLRAERILRYSRYHYPVSMFDNVNGFATFMLISVFIIYVCLLNTKRMASKLIYTSTLVSTVILLFSTGSRANILGLITSLLFFVYLLLQNRRSRRRMIILLIVALLFILVYPNLLNSLILAIGEQLSFRFSEQLGSDVTRINLIKNGFSFLTDTFGFGTGAGNIEYWMANYGVYFTGGVENIHNWWIEILIAYGLVIFVMYIIFYIKLFRTLYKKYRFSKDKRDMTIALGILCNMVGFAIGSISSSSNISSEWLWVFWAIAIAYQGIPIQREIKTNII